MGEEMWCPSGGSCRRKCLLERKMRVCVYPKVLGLEAVFEQNKQLQSQFLGLTENRADEESLLLQALILKPPKQCTFNQKC